MSWTITEDCLGDEPEAVGKVGPRDTDKESVDISGDPKSVLFRLLDDDGELYYEGYWLDDKFAYSELDPLDDFGMPNAGCTEMKVWNEKKQGWTWV